MKTINDVAAILSNRRKELNLEQSFVGFTFLYQDTQFLYGICF